MMKPADVNRSNKDQVWITLYGYIEGDFPIPKFKVDNTVRVLLSTRVFSTRDMSLISRKKYLRSQRYFAANMYELEEASGDDPEPIIGKFHEEELSAVSKTDDVYRVEKILRRRKGQALVKWAGYDSKHSSWIPIKDIQSLK